jgi:hypothetical protein
MTTEMVSGNIIRRVLMRKAPKYAMISVLVLGGILLTGTFMVLLGLIPYCTNTELQRVESPDGKWSAIVRKKICNSTFSGPFKSVVIRDISRSDTQSNEQTLVDFEMGSLDDLLSVKWSSLSVLDVTISDEIKYFAKKETSYGNISINYSIVPARPFSAPSR